jgi:glutamate racemase
MDALVLGCTHYPFASKAIRKVLGPEVALLDGGEGTAKQTQRRLEQAGLLSEGNGHLTFLTSSESQEMLDRMKTLFFTV